MAKDQSFPAGSRRERPHAPDGWQTGGRKDDSTYDQNLADKRAHDKKSK